MVAREMRALQIGVAVMALVMAQAAGCSGRHHGGNEGYGSVAREREERRSMAAGGELHGAEVGPAVTHRELAKERLVDDRPATAEELAALDGLMKRAEQIRELSFKRKVSVRVQSKRGMRAFLRDELETTKHLERAHHRYIAMGLLDPEVKVKALLDQASKAELQGYYDPKKDVLVLRDDVAYGLTMVVRARENLEWRTVIVHELVHALQDQHFELGAALDRERSTDETHAYMALVEGDATLAMLQYMLGRVGLNFRPLTTNLYELDRMINGLPSTSGSGALASPLAEQPGLFRYRAGVIFAAGLWREGGMREVDRAYRVPPVSTQEVLDPLLFLAREKRAVCRLPPLSSAQQAGYGVLEQDTMGRIELSVYLQQGGMGGDLIARTWQCDRVAVLERGGTYASVWLIKMLDIDSVNAVVARANEGVGAVTRAAKRPFLAYAQLDFAVIVHNVDAKLHDAIKREVADWIASGKAMKN